MLGKDHLGHKEWDDSLSAISLAVVIRHNGTVQDVLKPLFADCVNFEGKQNQNDSAQINFSVSAVQFLNLCRINFF